MRSDTAPPQILPDAQPIASLKATLRGHMRAVRAAMTEEQRALASSRICAHLQQLNLQRAFKGIAVYLALPVEAKIDAFAESLIRHGVTVAAPSTQSGVAASFYTLRDLRGGVRLGGFGVREPLEYSHGRIYQPQELDLIIAPGLAFDVRGGRLGFGGGWYDRALQSGVLSIGVCFDCQIGDAVPREEHDRSVAAVVTESRIIDVAGQLEARLGQIDEGGSGNNL